MAASFQRAVKDMLMKFGEKSGSPRLGRSLGRHFCTGREIPMINRRKVSGKPAMGILAQKGSSL